MRRTMLTAALAGMSMIAAGPALAQVRVGGSGGATIGGNVGASLGGMNSTVRGQAGGQANVGVRGDRGGVSGDVGGRTDTRIRGNVDAGSTIRTDTRINSQASVNANARATERANVNSAVHGSVSSETTLSGVQAGMMVHSSTGAMIGTVSRVITARNGTIARVLVRSSDGRTLSIPAGSLSLSGGVVMTTMASVH